MPDHSRARVTMLQAGFALAHEAFNLEDGDNAAFLDLEKRVVAFQRQHCAFYDRFCAATDEDAMWLPVEAFGLTTVAAFDVRETESIFVSSGTGAGPRSRHYVRSLGVYQASVVRAFTRVIADCPVTFLAHLPGYLGGEHAVHDTATERSSLVEMADTLMHAIGDAGSGFFLKDTDLLERALSRHPSERAPVVLLGAAFGLLDMAESNLALRFGPGDRVIETGGMKTYRHETTRDELHNQLAAGLNVPRQQILSEYGMCELFSQFYDAGTGYFRGPPWTRVAVVDPDDPLRTLPFGQVGRIAIIDLANVFSVSRLLTSDRGVQTSAGFKVLGRLSGSALRGCNFLVEHALSASESG